MCHLEGCLRCFGKVLAVFLRGVAFLEGACSVLEWRGILEEVLAVFWRGVAFLEGTCNVLGRDILEGACSVLEEGCGILEGACSVLEGHGKSTCDFLSYVAIAKYKI